MHSAKKSLNLRLQNVIAHTYIFPCFHLDFLNKMLTAIRFMKFSHEGFPSGETLMDPMIW